MPSRWIAPFFVLLIIASIAFGYFALNTQGTFRPREAWLLLNYNMLAESILEGRLYLKERVDPGRLSSVDPADPGLPYPYIVDAIIFNGKYYFTAGPFPGILHAVWIAMTGTPLPTGLVVVFSATGVLVIIGLILLRVREIYFKDLPVQWVWFSWLLFALSGPQLYMVSRPVVYHEAISLGMLFVTGATLLIISPSQSSGQRLRQLAASGLLLGMAVACRPNLVVYPLCFLILITVAAFQDRLSYAASLRQILSFVLPVFMFLVILAGYNYARFGGALDFGRRCAALPDPRAYEYCSVLGREFRLAHMRINMYNYLFLLPETWKGTSIPVPVPVYTVRKLVDGDVFTVNEAVVSMFLFFPAIVLAFPLAYLTKAGKGMDGLKTLRVVLPCLLGSGVSFVLLTAYYRAAPRYIYEFTPLLFVVIFCNIALVLHAATPRSRLGRATKVMLGILFIGNILAGIHLGLSGTSMWR